MKVWDASLLSQARLNTHSASFSGHGRHGLEIFEGPILNHMLLLLGRTATNGQCIAQVSTKITASSSSRNGSSAQCGSYVTVALTLEPPTKRCSRARYFGVLWKSMRSSRHIVKGLSTDAIGMHWQMDDVIKDSSAHKRKQTHTGWIHLEWITSKTMAGASFLETEALGNRRR